MEPATPKAAESENSSAGGNLGSVTPEMERVRAAASALIEKAGSASSVTDAATALEKAAGALKVAEEIAKTRTELTKFQEEISKLKRENEKASTREISERIRDYVALLTPLVTIITLAATLIAQNWQFLRSERDKREDALDAQWNDSVKFISTSGALSPGVIALQPFLHSPKYGERAKELAVTLLSSSSDPVFFTSLFDAALVPVGWDNFDRVLRLDHALIVRASPLFDKIWDEAKYQNDLTRLAKDERPTYDYVIRVVPVITAQIGSVLKTEKPPGRQIDLSAMYFQDGDWKGIDFGNANVERTYFSGLDLRDSELKGVTKFDFASFYATAWWEVKSISKPFLEYLMRTFPLKPGQSYGPRDEIPTQDEYNTAISRLRSQLK
jgi:hypothetical protein